MALSQRLVRFQSWKSCGLPLLYSVRASSALCCRQKTSQSGHTQISCGLQFQPFRERTVRFMATTSESEKPGDNREDQKPAAAMSRAKRLKVLAAQYGSVVMVFHISMSLASLGLMYTAVSAGLDVVMLASKVGVDLSGSVASSASTFAVAYVAHKVLAPVRIAITAAAVPAIVPYLRRLGYMRAVPPRTENEEAEKQKESGETPAPEDRAKKE